jgi:calcineurin-like phosphoesterase family protein
MNLFFTSDEHYGHRNIIDYCKRPYANVDEMTRDLINRHNARITPGKAEHALTWHLGDMFWNSMSVGEAKSILYSLNGQHAFVFGNHDELILENQGEFKSLFRDMQWYAEISGVGNKRGMVLCHYSMRTWRHSHKGAWHLFGHSHSELPSFGLSFDVGVDNVGKMGLTPFSPASLQEVTKIFEKLKMDKTQFITSTRVWPGKEPSPSKYSPFDHLPEGSH